MFKRRWRALKRRPRENNGRFAHSRFGMKRSRHSLRTRYQCYVDSHPRFERSINTDYIRKKKGIGVSEKKEESILFAISLYRVTVLDKKLFDIRLAFNVLKNWYFFALQIGVWPGLVLNGTRRRSISLIDATREEKVAASVRLHSVFTARLDRLKNFWSTINSSSISSFHSRFQSVHDASH